jgi:hypothetical protein
MKKLLAVLIALTLASPVFAAEKKSSPTAAEKKSSSNKKEVKKHKKVEGSKVADSKPKAPEKKK